MRPKHGSCGVLWGAGICHPPEGLLGSQQDRLLVIAQRSYPLRIDSHSFSGVSLTSNFRCHWHYDLVFLPAQVALQSLSRRKKYCYWCHTWSMGHAQPTANITLLLGWRKSERNLLLFPAPGTWVSPTGSPIPTSKPFVRLSAANAAQSGCDLPFPTHLGDIAGSCTTFSTIWEEFFIHCKVLVHHIEKAKYTFPSRGGWVQ